jgi:hypothetical protein
MQNTAGKKQVQEDDEESDYLFGSNFLLRGTVSSRASLQQQKSSMRGPDSAGRNASANASRNMPLWAKRRI